MQQEVRKRGIGRGLGEETPNIAALAAPVFAAIMAASPFASA